MSEEHRKRILVVDDEADVRAYLSMALEDAGFEVMTAADGLDALEMARKNLPDLISLDLIMPRHSGARCYHDLQKDKHLAKIPVLIVTGHARDQLGRADFEEMTMSGPGIYLEKPVSPDLCLGGTQAAGVGDPGFQFIFIQRGPTPQPIVRSPGGR
jgi:CheY-like chemotaxis protein